MIQPPLRLLSLPPLRRRPLSRSLRRSQNLSSPLNTRSRTPTAHAYCSSWAHELSKERKVSICQKNATVSGTCGSDIQLVFAGKTLKISYAKTDEDKKWEVSDFAVVEANTTTVFKDNDTKTYKVGMDEAFSCRTLHKIANGDMTLTVKEFQMQPFVKGDKFGRVIHCEADKAANNVVPIAVGAALAVLVIIVLVLYLIGRQKHQKGYQ